MGMSARRETAQDGAPLTQDFRYEGGLELVERSVFVVESQPLSLRDGHATGARPADNPQAHGARPPHLLKSSIASGLRAVSARLDEHSRNVRSLVHEELAR